MTMTLDVTMTPPAAGRGVSRPIAPRYGGRAVQRVSRRSGQSVLRGEITAHQLHSSTRRTEEGWSS